MQRRFAEIINEMRGLIGNGSAPLCHPASCPSPSVEGSPSLLLAVSGGIDSMCMADLFFHLSPALPFAVAHCNFRLRGEDSDGDEALVRSWADSNGVRFFSTSFDTVEYASEYGISIEMAARELRYGWFAELCREHGFTGVAVAHNANDNAETLMLNMLRGAGLKGLTGMSAVSSLPCPRRDDSLSRHCEERSDVAIFRPLLTFTRKQIEGYAFAHKVAYREDRTNALSDYKRNRIRNEVFPVFEKINPSFIRTLNRGMGYFAEASDLVDDWCRTASSNLISHSRIDIHRLMAHSHWRYLLYYMLEPYGFNSSSLASIEDLLSSSRTISGKRFGSDTHILTVERDELVLMPRGAFPEMSRRELKEDAVMPVRIAGTYRFNGARIQVEEIERTPDMLLRMPDGVIMMDADRLRTPFVLRRWRKGDWLVPFGMRGKKKVSDLFADLKYDSEQKESAIMVVDTLTPGLADASHIAAVAGVRIDDRYKVTSGTSRIWKITVSVSEDD